MRCGAEDCDPEIGDDAQMEPCKMCRKPVHHLCSLKVYSDDLHTRFCSNSCFLISKLGSVAHRQGQELGNGICTENTCAGNHTRAEQNHDYGGSDTDSNKTGGDADDDCIFVGSPFTSNQLVEAEEVKTDMENVSSNAEPEPVLDQYGIPESVKHSQKDSGHHEVWTYIHVLEKPIEHLSSGAQIKWKHNICLLCVRDAVSRPRHTSRAWMKGLCTTAHTTNAVSHFRRKHKTHCVAVAAEAAATARAKGKLTKTTRELAKHTGKRPVDPVTSRNVVRVVHRKTLDDHFRPTSDLVNSAVSNWLTSDGIPYNVVTTDAFKNLIKVATGNLNFVVSSRDTYDATLNARFEQFTRLVSSMLKFNSEHMYGLKFLNVIHDGWRNKNGDSIIGVSLAFIDNQWKFRHIAVLATVMPEGHEACEVAKMIKERSVKIYGVDFVEMMKWMMSDTANSARAVANYFPDADQEDCSMHLMNLCISYGLGLRENYKTKKEKNGRSVRSVVTPGGPFLQGKEVIRKLRALNNYFNSGNRANALRAVQQALSYPELTSYLDVDTRVASSCKLMWRSGSAKSQDRRSPLAHCARTAD